MKYKISNSEFWTPETLERVLLYIFEMADLTWIKWVLSARNFPNRTNIYTAFQHSYYYNKKVGLQTNRSFEMTEIQRQDRETRIRSICSDRETAFWIIEHWLQQAQLGRIAVLAMQSNLHFPLTLQIDNITD